MHKKIIAVFLIASQLVGLCSCGAAENAGKTENTENPPAPQEGRYPVEWDGTLLYADYDAWLADYGKIRDYPQRFAEFKGTLHTVEGLRGVIETMYDGEFRSVYDKLFCFTEYGINAFPSDPLYAGCKAKLDVFRQDYENAIAYVDEEMQALTFGEREALFSDASLQPYAYAFRKYLDPDKKYLSEEETIVRNTLNISRDRMPTLYSLFAKRGRYGDDRP